MQENTTQPQKEFPKLTGRKAIAFQMKFDGETYQKISEATNLSSNYIAKVFYKGGAWREHYDWWEEIEVKEIERVGRLRIKKRIAEALTVQETMLVMVKSNPKEAARAARDLLDRAGLKAPEKIEVTDADDKAEKMAKWFEGKSQTENKNE